MIKKIDKMGRIVLPISFRDELGINLNDEVKITREGDKIIIQNSDYILSRKEIEKAYEEIKTMNNSSEYVNGFRDALNLVLKRRGNNEN